MEESIVRHTNSIHAHELQALQAHRYEPCTQLTQPTLSSVCIFAGVITIISKNSKRFDLPLLAKLTFLKNFIALEWTLVLSKPQNAKLNDLSALHCSTSIKSAHVNAV